MSKTEVTGKQLKDGSVQRVDLDTTTSGQAVISKVIAGSGVTISSTGSDSGTGDVTINSLSTWKSSVRVATTGAGTLSTSFENGDTVDGVTLATGDRILIKNQSTGSENGIYTVNASGSPTRAIDADTSAEVLGGMGVYVNEGTTNADTLWFLSTNDPITLGSTSLTFTQFTAGGGSGITTLNTLTASTQTFATGTSGTDFNISSVTSTHTFNIPDASGSNRGLITTGTQTLAGVKTFSSAPNFSSLTASRPLKLDGSNNVTATQITLSSANDVTGTLATGNGGTGLSSIGTANQLLSVNTGATALEYRTLQTGTTGTDFNIDFASGTVTLHIPDASASNRGLVTTGTQTLAGAKTFSSNVTISSSDLVFSTSGSVKNIVTTGLSGNGTTQGSGTALSFGKNEVTTATAGANDAFVLPATSTGKTVTVFNRSSATIQIFPPSGSSIDSGAANAAYLLTTTASVSFTAKSSTVWFTEGSSGSTTSGQNGNPIDDIRVNTNITEEVFGNFNVFTFSNTADGKIDFTVPLGTQPITDIDIGIIYVARGSTSGNLKWNLNYNLLDSGDDASTTTYANTTNTGSIALVSGDQNLFKTSTLTIPIATLNGATAPFQIMGQIQRDTSVGSNYGADVSIIGVYVNKLPSSGGYTAGDLTVSGKITNYSDSTPAANAAIRRTFKTTTTNATTTTIATIAVTDNCINRFSIKVGGHWTSTSSDKNYWASIEGAVRRRNAGSAALVGTRDLISDSEGSPGYSCSITVSGNNLLIQVTGAASETVVWTAIVDYQEAV